MGFQIGLGESELNISDNLARALRLFEIKIQCNLTFNQIMKATSSDPISLYHINQDYVEKISEYGTKMV